METSTNIRTMFAGNQIIVPNYQRAYAWDTSLKSEQAPKQVNVFLSDLEEHLKSQTKSKYYFGHFLFEVQNIEGKEVFYVVDGQQRMTTIVIFISTLLKILNQKREAESIDVSEDIKNEELDIFEDMIKRRGSYRFKTVYYDNQNFIDLVVDGKNITKSQLETESAKRIYDTYHFFLNNLAKKSEEELKALLDLVINASCTTHSVQDESEAIQMFIFQNNRGKKPSNLEVLKAEFMFYLHLYAGEEKEALIEEIKNRFETIYRAISTIEHKINEDDVLRYVVRVYFNSLWESDALVRIRKELEDSNKLTNCVIFIKEFTKMLSDSFKYLIEFYQDERDSLAIHSLIVTKGKIGVVMPFILKAYLYQLTLADKEKLCEALGSLLLRDRLIRTRAELESRLNNVYSTFSSGEDISAILKRVDYLKNVTSSEHGWASYWNGQALENSLSHLDASNDSKLICLLLWKYETYLQRMGKKGYKDFLRFDEIEKPEVEHIAPKTEPKEKKAAGYGNYTETFYKEGLDSFGNYLLISKSHNCSIGNIPFDEKLASYKMLEQQREIKEFLDENEKWDLKAIKRREEKLWDFFLTYL
ncbi:DUF262 domain-containing protein [Actinobacillus pleuropneumoniae]|nr:DUF262 domain-containing protein [Actinobacillus pleuropneumoniae]EFL81735.1 hypothetical protein APP6_0913 [Actinobacillus pleuropneumoniae serovar 6 str. Femo]SUU60463.1 Uncharacterized conserved protein [Actinobacillus pleuropneumoniae]